MIARLRSVVTMWTLTVGLLAAAVPAAAQAPAQAPAQDPAPAAAACAVDTLAADFPADWAGTTVGQITVRARGVETPFRFATDLAHYVHRATQLNVALNELSFSPGKPVDSLDVKESVRRLRATGIYSEVLLVGSRCGNTLDFTLWTRDAWSLKTSVKLSESGTSRASFSEVNLLGTGRAVSVAGEQVDGRNALSVSIVDPHLIDTRFRAAALLRTYADGRAWIWSARTRELSERDVWRVALTSSQERRLSSDSAAGTFVDITRRADALTVSRLVSLGATAAWAVVAGAEHELTDESVTQPGGSLGQSSARRSFVAPLVGVSRRSRQYGSIDWLVPGQAPAELREGLEGELVVGAGHDLFRNTRITHLDAWMGITQLLDSSTVFTGDVWSSGYWSDDSVQNGTLRTSVTLMRRAARGMWIFRGGWEHIYNPDPDVFALSTIDPLLRSLAPASRLAEQALSVSAERSLHLYSKEGRWVVDGALWAAFSDRHRSFDGVALDPANYRAVIVGIGFRQVRNQPTQAPLRLDIGRAVSRSPGLPNRWIVSLSTVPWINAGRTRDGLREAR